MGKIILASVVAIIITATPALAAPNGGKVKKAQIAKGANWELDVRAGVGYLTGQSDNYVFDTQQDSRKISELNWKIDNMFMMGVGASISYNEWLKLNADGWFKVSDGSGELDDYDWLNPAYVEWSDHSMHDDTDVVDGSLFDVNVEAIAYKTESLSMSAIIGYKRDSFGWEARGGSYIYSEGGGFRNFTGNLPNDELAISYEQTFESVYFGIGTSWTVGAFNLDGRFIYSPFVDGEATDHHPARQFISSEEVSGGDMFGFDIAGTYSFTDSLGLQIAYQYQNYSREQGDRFYDFYATGVTFDYQDGAGMEHYSSLITFMLTYRL